MKSITAIISVFILIKTKVNYNMYYCNLPKHYTTLSIHTRLQNALSLYIQLLITNLCIFIQRTAAGLCSIPWGNSSVHKPAPSEFALFPWECTAGRIPARPGGLSLQE